jgi:hypothetical protein
MLTTMSFIKSLRITVPEIFKCAAVLCLLTLPIFAQTSRREKTIIKFENLISALETAKTDRTPITTITKLIREHGVDFQVTPEMEDRIRSTGSYLSKESLDDLVSTVRNNYRPPQPSAASVGAGGTANKSIEDIMAFVKGKLSDSTFGYRVLSKKSSQPPQSILYTYDNVEVDQCKLIWQEKRTFRWNERNPSPDTSLTLRFEINLSDIDPEQIRLERLYEPETWSIIMATTNSEKKIKVTEFDTTSFLSESEVTFSDKRLAERVSLALKDFVRRCGGKKESY